MMRKLALALVALLLLAPAAHAQKTKAAMTTEINTNLPDNTTGLITPAVVRSTLIDMVNSWYGLVDATNVGTGASTFAQINQTGATSGIVTLQTQAAAGTWNWNWPITAGSAGQTLVSQGGGGTAMTWSAFNNYAGQTQVVSAGNPAATTSTTGVMMGVGSTCKITPATSTRVYVSITANEQNNTASDGAGFDIRFGTGAAPANGAALTGTVVTPARAFIVNNANTASASFSASNAGIMTGLTPGTAYWIDASLLALTGGTATLSNVGCVSFEM